MIEEELDDICLGSIKRLIAGKSNSEIITIRNELVQGLHNAVSGIKMLPVGDAHRKHGEDAINQIRNHIMQRRLEVKYLNALIGDTLK